MATTDERIAQALEGILEELRIQGGFYDGHRDRKGVDIRPLTKLAPSVPMRQPELLDAT